jgi:gliding motility-associated-like protein
VLQDNTLPQVTVTGDTLTCASPTVQLSAQSSMPALIWSWTGPGGFSSNQQSPVVQTPGQYALTATSPANGCSASAQVIVLQDNTLPQVTVTGDTLTCASPTVQLSAQSSMPALVWSWTGPGGFSSNQQSPVVQTPGQYALTATSPANGCSASAQVIVLQDNTLPQVTVTGDTLTCASPTGQLSAQSSSPALVWSWTGPGGFSSNQQSPVVQMPGQYALTATSPANGCSASVTIEVTDNRQYPVVVQATDSLSITCLNDTITIEIQLQTPAAVSWQTPQGMLGQSTILKAFIPGDYIWTAVGPGGCSVQDTIRVFDRISPIYGVSIDLQPASCFGDASAKVVIGKLEGGIEPYVFSFGNQAFGDKKQWSGIPAGAYMIRVREAGGCEWDTILTVVDPPEWSIWLPSDTMVFRGETLLLEAQTDLPAGQLKHIYWHPPISCDTCFHRTTKVYFDQWFIATAVDLAGCSHSDSMFVLVNQKHNVFIPNIFSPNSDGENDAFQIFADSELERIGLFRIYDRWGELLHEEKDIKPGTEHGWDGRFRQQALSPGVYTWVAVLIFKGGIEEQYVGDVTLLR